MDFLKKKGQVMDRLGDLENLKNSYKQPPRQYKGYQKQGIAWDFVFLKPNSIYNTVYCLYD